MKLITEEKVYKFLNENYPVQNTGKHVKVLSNSDRKNAESGIEFAEIEFQNIIVEFAEFLGKKHYRYNEIMMYWFNDRMTNTFTTEELLLEFSETRKG